MPLPGPRCRHLSYISPEDRMGRRDAVLTLRLDAELADRLDAVTRRLRTVWRAQKVVYDGTTEKPGELTRSKVARAALVRGLLALEEAADEVDARVALAGQRRR